MTLPVIERKPASRPLPAEQREEVLASPGFGDHFTDHMVTITWTEDAGWHRARLVPYGPLPIDPANLTLHYAQTVFEGLKVHRRPGGALAAFRPEDNARRFQASARRMAMPELPVETFVAACEALVQQDRAWVPSHPGHALYLRPFMFATESGLGVRAAREFLFVVIASPTEGYFAGEIRPVSVWVAEDHVRAAPGGTGAAKTGANYAASLMGQAQAAAQGCDQVVWLDALERRWVEEMGAMNLFFVYGERVVTPGLTGTLLPGITRASLLTLARDLGHEAEEARISLQDWRRDSADGSLTEVFACGTAAGVVPVGSVKTAHDRWTVGDGRPGRVTMRLREALRAIQSGTAADTRGWMREMAQTGHRAPGRS
ncbi:branched-chain amino acid aminotransferase [Planotetraspora kaengkrachanensis]|uniref:Branched-chain-amino-acid aminotransferase n=1 Tax=Planotetraspora kaengkrachanensis TaxID=575193 RepID=A0A8J3M589_9ACTN|nr:branched-chain amino acid aminotransferase [Planotetraspora kaengkrachanensis]GIG79495.1 putative branched-chain-amino-acid aminotransferase [Planotetraspora kaengkrachanensis]